MGLKVRIIAMVVIALLLTATAASSASACRWQINNNGNAPVHYPEPNSASIKTKFPGEIVAHYRLVQKFDFNLNLYDGVELSGHEANDVGWIYVGHLTLIEGGGACT